MITNAHPLTSDPIETLHHRLFGLARSLRRHEHALAVELARMEQCRGFRRYAATMRQYASEFLGLERGKGGDLLRIGRALRTLPVTAAAMADGTLPWTKVRELAKVVTPETESGWVRNAEDWSTRELQRVVREHQKGDDPPDPSDVPPESATTELRFELSATDDPAGAGSGCLKGRPKARLQDAA